LQFRSWEYPDIECDVTDVTQPLTLGGCLEFSTVQFWAAITYLLFRTETLRLPQRANGKDERRMAEIDDVCAYQIMPPINLVHHYGNVVPVREQTSLCATHNGQGLASRKGNSLLIGVPMRSSSERRFQFPAWQPQYQAAITETDPGEIRQRVAAAEAAIVLRSQLLLGKTDCRAEQAALADALRAILRIQVEKLNYPKSLLVALTLNKPPQP
jgi:hypothetical protein